jgi:hypothetical protein
MRQWMAIAAGSLAPALFIVPLVTLGSGGCGSTIAPLSGDGGGGDAPPDVQKLDVALDRMTVVDSSPNDAPTSDASEAGDSGFQSTPPPPPTGPMTTSTTPNNLAIHHLYLGDTDFSGKTDGKAWAGFGYNIDGKVTTATSTNVCTLFGGGGSFGPFAQVDGDGGIDNSFGENIFPGIIEMVDSTASSTINSAIAGGAFTLMFDVTGLSSSSTQTATGLSAQIFGGGVFPGTPTWTVADDWPVLDAGLTSTTPPFVSVDQFPDAYVVAGTWVSGSPSDINLPLTLDGLSLPLVIHDAVVTFQHTTPTHAAAGEISGVLDTTEFVAAITALAGRLSSSLCSGGALAGIVAEIESAQDILTDGTNPEGMPCTGISIGLGFTADEIGQPDTLTPVVISPNPCDGGTDGG